MLNRHLLLLIFFLYGAGVVSLQAQLTVTEGAAMNLTPLQLVQSQLVGQGITVTNATFNGSSGVIDSDQIGYFSTAGPAILQLGINDGVILSSGMASNAIGPNGSPGTGSSTTFGADPDLNIIANITTNDKCVLEFDFVPQADTLKFRYVFGSEEFYEFCNSYNDAFGFFLSGPGITGTFSNSSVNIALMPESANYVTIYNLCADGTSNWNNAGGAYFQYDGMSYVFTAWHVVIPCSTYHIKLAVADASDKALDSGVFLEKNSFNATGLLITNSFSAPKYGNKSVEGCNAATVSFVLQQPTILPYTVNWTVGGTAINGTDYDTIGTSIIIPAGEDSAAIVINPYLDGLTEPTEYVVLGVTVPSCSGPTIFNDTIYILDNTPFTVAIGNDTTICLGDSISITATPSGGKYPYDYMWNTGSTWGSITVTPPVGTNTYIATVTDGCWSVDKDTMVVTIDSLPLVTNTVLLSEICSQAAATILPTSNKTGATFIWTANCSSPNVSGYSGGSGTTINQTLVNTGITFDTVKYHVHAVYLGCIGLEVVFKVVVKPKPDAYFSPNGQNICTGQTIDIDILSNVPGTTFSWTYTTTPFISGALAGTGNNITQTLVNSGSTIDTVTYHVTPIENTCTGNIYNVKAIVNPYPIVITTPLFDTICSNTSTNIQLISSVPGSTFTWTASIIAGNVSGFANGSGSVIAQQLVNNDITIGKVKYRIIPSANGCLGAPQDFQVLVDPIPAMTNTIQTSQICAGLSTNVSLQSNINGTTFSWTATASSANITGFSNGTGNTISQTLNNSGFNLDSVTYHVTPAYNGCNGIPMDFVVRVKPIPDAYSNPLLENICSGVTTSIALFSHTAGSTFTWTASASSSNITGFSNGANDSIKQTLVNSGYTVETVTYLVTPSANGCNGIPPLSIIVTVYPVPDLSNSPLSKQICNNQATNITLTSHVAGTLFTWTASGSTAQVTGFSNNSTPSTFLDQILVNSGFNVETVTYTLTSFANGCSGIPTPFVVTVFPTPDLTNTPLSKGICQGNSTDITLTSNVAGALFTWTCTPSSGNVTGWSNNTITPLAQIDQVLNISSVVTETVTYNLTPVFNGCNGPNYSYIVEVNPVPMLTTNPMHDTICSGVTTSIHLTSTCAGTTFSWTATNPTGNISGFGNGSGAWITQSLTNLANSTGGVLYTIIPTAGLCTGDDTIYNIFIYPKPHLTNAVLTSSLCSNSPTNIPLTSDVSGTTFFWTASSSSVNVTGFNAGNGTLINDFLINSGFTTETVTYRIVLRANGCNGDTSVFTVTLFPVPDAYAQPASEVLCSGDTTELDLFSQAAGTTFTWTASGSSAQVSGFSAGGGTQIEQKLTNAGTLTELVTYTVTPTANGCPAGPSVNIPVTVFPVTIVNTAPLAQTICNNTQINVGLTATVSGTTFSWSCTASSPSLSGFSAGAGDLISQTLLNSGYTIETVTYHIQPLANGCNGPITNYVVTVNPTPDLSNSPAASQVCNNTSTAITLTSNVSGTLFTWTASGSSAQVTGYSNNSIPSGTINQVLNNAGLNVETVTYSLTPHANGCDGLSTNFVVTVVSSPDVYFSPTSQTICSQETTNLQLLSSVPGTTFTWTATGTSPLITGFSAGNGTSIQQSLTNSGVTMENVTYTVTPTAWGCPPGVAQNVTVNVNPKPVVTNSLTTFSVCSQGTTNILPTSSVLGSTYTWTASGSSSQVSGFANGSGLTIQQTLVNSGFNTESVTYLVSPVASGCQGDAVAFVVTVYPVADAFFTPNGQTICPLQNFTITIGSHVTGATFTWTAAGSTAQVTGYSNGSGNLIQQTLNNSGYSIENVTYIVSPVANGCPGTNNSVAVTINPAPVVSITTCNDIITTTQAKPFRLKGGVPRGGTYSGRGVVANLFDPVLTGVGTDTVIYSYTNGYGCNQKDSIAITVVAPVFINCGDMITDIRDNSTYPTVQIGSHCWMAANLNYGTPVGSSMNQRDDCVPEKYCSNDNPSNCATTGGLYQWDEVMQYESMQDVQGFCPPGWHVPNENEWNTLFNYYISSGFAGSPLKSTGYSGFNALLDGAKFKNVNWSFGNFATFFWSSVAHGQFKAWAHGMNDSNPSVSFYPSSRSNAFPVRCLKD
jgi:uncharacterized protein (TIGR02145 family)